MLQLVKSSYFSKSFLRDGEGKRGKEKFSDYECVYDREKKRQPDRQTERERDEEINIIKQFAQHGFQGPCRCENTPNCV